MTKPGFSVLIAAANEDISCERLATSARPGQAFPSLGVAGDRARRPLGRLESLHDRLGVAGSCGQAGLEIDPSLMVHDRLTHHGTETGHAIRKPARHASTMKRKEGTSRSARHRISLSTY